MCTYIKRYENLSGLFWRNCVTSKLIYSHMVVVFMPASKLHFLPKFAAIEIIAGGQRPLEPGQPVG
jgi:hypothetical protein